MPESIGFKAAAGAAFEIIEQLANRPNAGAAERLSHITYTVLEAIYRANPGPEDSMFVIDRAADQAVHLACSRIANRVVFLIRPLIRAAGDRDLPLREAYAIARQELERHGSECHGGGPVGREGAYGDER
jgi:hypothetical protein